MPPPGNRAGSTSTPRAPTTWCATRWRRGCAPRSHPRGGRRRPPGARRSARFAAAPTTRPGTRTSRRAVSWRRRGPSRTAGLGLTPAQARVAEAELAPYNLGRLNPLGLNSAAPALFAFGTEEQRARFLPPIVANTERWCQLLSEPGAGSRPRVPRDARGARRRRVDPRRAEGVDDLGPRRGLRDLPRPHRPDGPQAARPHVLRRGPARIRGDACARCATSAARSTSTRCSSTAVRVPDDRRIGAPGEGWRVAGATLAGERQMVSGVRVRWSRPHRWCGRRPRAPPCSRSSAARARPGGASAHRRALRRGADPGLDEPAGPGRGGGGGDAGPRRLDRQGPPGSPQPGTPAPRRGSPRPRRAARGRPRTRPSEAWVDGRCPTRSRGMLRSRANTIEGGTTEVNMNVLGEKVLGLPREPDPCRDAAWEQCHGRDRHPRRAPRRAPGCPGRPPARRRRHRAVRRRRSPPRWAHGRRRAAGRRDRRRRSRRDRPAQPGRRSSSRCSRSGMRCRVRADQRRAPHPDGEELLDAAGAGAVDR